MENPLSRYIMFRVLIDITENTNLSTEAVINGWRVVGVAMPSGWTTADLAFQVDPGDGTFRKVYDRLGAYFKIDPPAADGIYMLRDTEAAATGQDIPIVGAKVKVHSIDASDETDEAQGADRIIWLLCVPA